MTPKEHIDWSQRKPLISGQWEKELWAQGPFERTRKYSHYTRGVPLTPTDLKIEALLKKRQAVDAKINAAQALIKENRRREETRLKVLVGAALLTDVMHHPETRVGLVAALKRAIITPKDIEFLKAKGWL